MPVVFFILGLSCFAIAITTGGSLSAFVDVPSLVVVFASTTLVGVGFHSPGGLLAACRLSLSGAPAHPATARAALATLRTMRSLAWASGFVGFFIGLVQMLANLDDPSAIGPSMATAVLSPMYGLMLAEFLLRPMAHRVEARIAPS